jgi:hypothetical protein
MSDKLWKVVARKDKGRGYALPEGSLWILAKSANQATDKAVRWLKKNGYVQYRVTAVEFEGTIDVF